MPKAERIRDIELSKQVGIPLSVLREASAKGKVPRAALIGSCYTYDIPTIRVWLRRPHAKALIPTPPARKGFVYVIAGGEHIKIGFAVNVAARLRGLQTASPHPLRLIHPVPALMADERRLHHRFAVQKAVGEWFRREGDLAAWIDEGCPI